MIVRTARHFFTIPEDDQGREALDAEFAGHGAVPIYVHPADHDLSLVVPGKSLQVGRDSPARSAPMGHEVDQGDSTAHLYLESRGQEDRDIALRLWLWRCPVGAS